MNHKRSNKQWHDCGDKPNIPENGVDVKCDGAYCAAVCPIGWRSRGRWRVKCQADDTWSHSKFSPCITCPDMSEELKGTNSAVQNIFRKNLPVTQIFCGDSSQQLQIKDNLFKQGGRKRNIKCECKNGQNGDPSWKKSCNWSFKGEPWTVQDVSTVTCRDKGYTPPGPITPKPPTIWKIGRNEEIFTDITIYPNYEISIDLKLAENKNTWWSNIFGFRVHGLQDPGFPQGSRIPAVFMHKESNRILVCSAVNGNGNACWASSAEMAVDTWFNLKIKQEAVGSKYVYQIFVDGNQIRSTVNNDPMTFQNVNGLIGYANQERDYLIPDGHYRNFEFESPQFGPTPAPVLDPVNRNEIIHANVTVHPIYSVSIDLNLERNPHKDWSNVFGFQKDGVIPDHSKGVFPQGSRIPAVFLYPQSTRLFVCSAVNDNGNTCWSSKEDMPTDTWFNLKIMQVWNEDVWSPSFTYKIFIDDIEMKSTENKSPMTFENVDGILGNSYEPDRNYLTAVAQYRNFEFDSQKTPHPEPWSDKRTTETINGIKYEAILFSPYKKPESENWAGSKKLCEDIGFQLPVPDSDEMNDFLVDFAPSGVYGEIHLGFKMEASEPNEDYKFNNVYSNEAITYSKWHRAEPNGDKTRETAIGLIVNYSGWHGKWYNFYTSSYRGIQYKGRPVHHICMKQI